MKKSTGTRLALAGLGTALSVIFVTLARFVPNLSLSFTVIAASGVMLPLCKNYYREGLLTCVAASVIGFFIVNIGIVSFVVASSFYIVFTVIWHNKGWNKTVGYCIKTAYSILAFYILYKLTGLITVNFALIPKLGNLRPVIVYILFNIVFTVAFIVYDIVMVYAYKYLKKLIAKIIK
ncbi:MAG TPA: hypothetical protein PKY53_05820 [Clostridia bacterium]|nr:hypothetical protein [Clostridia bacterium]